MEENMKSMIDHPVVVGGLSILLNLSWASLSPAQEWPAFQGPNASGRLPDLETHIEWGEESPPLLWEAELGPGFGGCAVRDGEVFLLDRATGTEDILRCFDLESGEEIWRLAYEARGRLPFPGSRTVPSIEEELLYTTGGLGHVYCFDRILEEEAWSLHLAEDFDGEMPQFGWSASPLVIDDKVVISPLGPEAGLLALDRFSADEIWRTESLGSSHSTPVLLHLHGQPQVVFLSTQAGSRGETIGWVSSFDPEDGSLLWRMENAPLARLCIPPPVQVAEDKIFVTGGYQAGSFLAEVQLGEEGYECKELFKIQRGAQIHLPIFHNDHLFVLVNENWNDTRVRQKEGGLLCLDLQGQEKWRTGNQPFFGRGGLTLLGDKLFIQDGHSGILRVVKPSSERYELLAQANVFAVEDRRDHQMWAPMAVSQGRLLIRSQDRLLCLDLRQP
jgi:hypothetical protein